MVRSHSCTEGFLMFGSNAPTAGASVLGWARGDKAADGLIVGVGTLRGKPVEIRSPGLEASAGGTTQPFDTVAVPVVGIFTRQLSKNPGILPAIAVTWNVESVSKSQA